MTILLALLTFVGLLFAAWAAHDLLGGAVHHWQRRRRPTRRWWFGAAVDAALVTIWLWPGSPVAEYAVWPVLLGAVAGVAGGMLLTLQERQRRTFLASIKPSGQRYVVAWVWILALLGAVAYSGYAVSQLARLL